MVDRVENTVFYTSKGVFRARCRGPGLAFGLSLNRGEEPRKQLVRPCRTQHVPKGVSHAQDVSHKASPIPARSPQLHPLGVVGHHLSIGCLIQGGAELRGVHPKRAKLRPGLGERPQGVHL